MPRSFRDGNLIIQGDSLAALSLLPDDSHALIYIDPPFNTGTRQTRTTLRTSANGNGSRTGFGGRTYATQVMAQKSYSDRHDDYLGFIRQRVALARDTLTENGSLFFHIDCREAHYCKVLLDDIFGRSSFINEIIWAYDYGGRSKTRWPAKHDAIFFYAKNPKCYTFNYDAIDRIPYLAPRLVTREKALAGKTPTDVWWNTIVSPTGREKTGYPNQKPLAILKRIIAVHSYPDERVLDFFAGSGTTGEAAAQLGRKFTLVDKNPVAVRVMLERLSRWRPKIEKLDKKCESGVAG